MRTLTALAVAGLLLTGAATALDLKGAVVDGKGKPVAGANVWLCQDLDASAASADESGAFAFKDVRADTAVVVAKKDGYSLGGAEVPVPGLGPVVVALGDPGTLDVVVKDEFFKPLAGVRVTHFTLNGLLTVPAEILSETTDFPLIASDDAGRLTLEWAPRGGYVGLVLAHRSYAAAFAPYLPVGGAQAPVQMYPGAKVRGRVSGPDVAGVPRARVALYRLDSADPDAIEEPVLLVADPEGYFHAVVRPGDYFVAARHPDYASPEPVKVAVVNDSEADALNVRLAAPHVVEGKVTGPDGLGRPGVPVSYLVGKALYAEATTQMDGHFRFLVPQAEGAVRVMAPPGHMTADYYETPIGGQLPARIDLGALRLVELPGVEGVVVGEDGEPAANVLVSSRDLELQARAITDTDGRFKLRLLHAPSDGRVRFRAEHAQRFQRADFEMDFKEVKPVRAALEPFDPDLGGRGLQPTDNDLTEMLGQAAPALECDFWTNADAIALDALKGKVVVLAFWGGFDDRPGSLDVIDELRAVADLYRKTDDVVVLSIHDSGSDQAEIERHVKRLDIRFPVGRDVQPGRTFEKYKVRYLPQVVVLDKKGALRHFQTRGRLLEIVKSLRREA